MSLVIATPTTRRRGQSSRSAGSGPARRLAVVPPEVPVWSAATTTPVGRAGGADEALLRARRAHPAGRGARRLSAVAGQTPFDQFDVAGEADRAPVEAVELVEAAPAPGLRLTRRGLLLVRSAVVAIVLLAVVCAVLVLGRQAQAGEQSAGPLPVTYRIVMPGETLWQIAGRVAPNTDRRDTVHKIIELNALPSAAVSAGQRIAVPIDTH